MIHWWNFLVYLQTIIYFIKKNYEDVCVLCLLFLFLPFIYVVFYNEQTSVYVSAGGQYEDGNFVRAAKERPVSLHCGQSCLRQAGSDGSRVSQVAITRVPSRTLVDSMKTKKYLNEKMSFIVVKKKKRKTFLRKIIGIAFSSSKLKVIFHFLCKGCCHYI